MAVDLGDKLVLWKAAEADQVRAAGGVSEAPGSGPLRILTESARPDPEITGPRLQSFPWLFRERCAILTLMARRAKYHLSVDWFDDIIFVRIWAGETRCLSAEFRAN